MKSADVCTAAPPRLASRPVDSLRSEAFESIIMHEEVFIGMILPSQRMIASDPSRFVSQAVSMSTAAVKSSDLLAPSPRILSDFVALALVVFIELPVRQRADKGLHPHGAYGIEEVTRPRGILRGALRLRQARIACRVSWAKRMVEPRHDRVVTFIGDAHARNTRSVSTSTGTVESSKRQWRSYVASRVASLAPVGCNRIANTVRETWNGWCLCRLSAMSC